MNDAIAIILIGRNEGERLKRALDSVLGRVDRIVYVDSGSTDHSVLYAQSKGIEVVELDMSIPFTAARARNAGVDALREEGLPEFLQFIDGDCILHHRFLERHWARRGPQRALSGRRIMMNADLTERVVRRELTPDDHQRLIGEAIDELEQLGN